MSGTAQFPSQSVLFGKAMKPKSHQKNHCLPTSKTTLLFGVLLLENFFCQAKSAFSSESHRKPSFSKDFLKRKAMFFSLGQHRKILLWIMVALQQGCFWLSVGRDARFLKQLS